MGRGERNGGSVRNMQADGSFIRPANHSTHAPCITISDSSISQPRQRVNPRLIVRDGLRDTPNRSPFVVPLNPTSHPSLLETHHQRARHTPILLQQGLCGQASSRGTAIANPRNTIRPLQCCTGSYGYLFADDPIPFRSNKMPWSPDWPVLRAFVAAIVRLRQRGAPEKCLRSWTTVHPGA